MCQHSLVGNVYAQVQLVYSLEVRGVGGGGERKASHAEGKAELHYRSFFSWLLMSCRTELLSRAAVGVGCLGTNPVEGEML